MEIRAAIVRTAHGGFSDLRTCHDTAPCHTAVMTTSSPISRRRLLQRAAVLGAGTSLGAAWIVRAAAPRAEVLQTRVISQCARHYHGWPTLAQRKNGELLLVCSGGRQAHVCPFGQVELMQSRDGGATWTFPRVLLDGPIDDRDAGVVETAKGTLLATTFTSLAYEPILERAEKAIGTATAWPAEKLDAWRGVHARHDAATRKRELGTWMLRSTDGGVTWSPRYDCIVNSPHGPFAAADGRMLYAGKDLWKTGDWNGVCESVDDGQTWRKLAPIPTRRGDKAADYHELHGVQAADGRLIVHLRNHNATDARETLQSESVDGGKTWTEPRAIGVWGLPSHLLRLKDGRLLMSYGHRRKPFGNQARVSADHGKTWSEPLTLSADGLGGDLGYPSTVELEDGSLLTAWYEVLAGNALAVLRQARWKLKS